ncbi:hypothetical protein EW145_g7953 [Phellinidium pouzarii]|uniref:Uncharacterized protein n=1 Tax=Phellinidium pouzarii TaxID=167371 RepID=A0A4V3X9U3_9AGAM|nr:hypothetical protein EW145_g7953 [Phellinidium pouzarii]
MTINGDEDNGWDHNEMFMSVFNGNLPVLKSLTLSRMPEEFLISCVESLSRQPLKLRQLESISMNCADVEEACHNGEEYEDLSNIREPIAPSLRLLELAGKAPFIYHTAQSFKLLNKFTFRTMMVDFEFYRNGLKCNYEESMYIPSIAFEFVYSRLEDAGFCHL